MDLTETQGKRIVANVRKVFEECDSSLLNRQAYHLMSQHMGFIAHYDLYGFQRVYADLRLLTENLQSSEYSGQDDYNLNWADELDRRYSSDPVRGCGQPPSVTATIRAVVNLAREYSAPIAYHFGKAERDAEIAEGRRLAEKHGLTLA